VLEVVQEEQDLLRPEVIGKVAFRTDRAGDRRLDQLGIAQCLERHPEHAVLEVAGMLRG
jgi:hypothetical protein